MAPPDDVFRVREGKAVLPAPSGEVLDRVQVDRRAPPPDKRRLVELDADPVQFDGALHGFRGDRHQAPLPGEAE